MSQRLEARLGLRLPGKVEILEGIKAGDTVVTAGHGRLMRGDSVPVRVIDLNAAAAGSNKAGGGGAKPGAAPGGGLAAAASGPRAPAQP